MLNIDEIMNGVVIDHITAGTGLSLYHLLELEKLSEASVALLQNVRSQKSGKKDIIKIEGDISGLNFDVLGYVDPQISLTFIENGHVTRKVRPDQPKRLVPKLRRLFARAGLERDEVNILRGLLSAVEAKMSGPGGK